MTTRQVAYRLKSEGKAELQRDLADVGRAGEASQKVVAGGVEKTNQAMDRQMERWRSMAAKAREQQAADERQAAFNRQLGIGGGSGKSAQDSAAAFAAANDAGAGRKGLTMMQRNTLLFTASDILSSAGNISPGRMLMQQGPQVFQAFAQDGAMATGTMLKLGLAVGGVAAAIGVTAAAALGFAKAMDDMNVAATGMGATAGLSGDQLNTLATNAAKAAGVSVGAAREMAASYVSTGRIGSDVLTGLIGITRDYARLTGQDAKAATEELGKAFADPARGAEALNDKLHFLDDTTYRYIQTLIAHGDTQKAQMVLLDALGPRVLHAADNFDVLGGSVNRAKNFVVDMFNWYGRLINRMAGGSGTLAEKIGDLERRRATYDPFVKSGNLAARTAVADINRQIAALQAQTLADWKTQGLAGQNQDAADARAIISKVIPQGRVDELRGQVAQLNKALKEGVLSPEGARDAQAALKKLNADIGAMAAGYKSAEDQASKLKSRASEAAAEARKAAAEAKKHADQQERLETLYFQNRVAIAKLRGLSGGVEDKGMEVEIQNRLRVEQLTKQYQEGGIVLARARAMAERQVGEEIRARSEGLAAEMVANVGYLKTLQAALAKGPVVYDENDKALQKLKVTAEGVFDRLTDPSNWGNWRDAGRAAIQDIIREFLILAAINPLKNKLFGGSSDYSPAPTLNVGSFLSSLFSGGKSVGHNAQGTDNWRGGWTEVGEQGRETVWLPQGSKVFSNARSQAMGGMQFAIHVYAEGAVLTDQVQGWVAAGVRQAVREANGNVPNIVNEQISRGRIAR